MIINDIKLWHALALILIAILTWVIKWYLSRLETIITMHSESIHDLISITKLHDHQIREAQEAISELKKRKRLT